ncbi:hypothetical protein NGA_2067610, partial [Nannochloropsis gaditana CCMP526]
PVHLPIHRVQNNFLDRIKTLVQTVPHFHHLAASTSAQHSYL